MTMLIVPPSLVPRIREECAPGKILVPYRLTNGEWAVSLNAKNDADFRKILPLLNSASSRVVLASEIASSQLILRLNSNDYSLDVDWSKFGRISCNDDFSRITALTMQNDIGWPGDVANNRDRCELNGKTNKIPFGTPFWMAWTVRIDTAYPAADAGNILIGQVHGASSTKAPEVTVNYGGSQLKVVTYSDDDPGVEKIRYSTATKPTVGVSEGWVLNGMFGASGFLKVWRNGVSVFDQNIPLGYYATEASEAWPKLGIYRSRMEAPFQVSFTPPEWGQSSLSHRISSPAVIGS